MTRLALLLTLGLGLTAEATTVLAESIDEMAVRAPIVVRAQVHQSQAGWSESPRRIWTWTELAITEVIKGKVPTVVLVKQPGGVVGPVGQAVPGVASFAAGEDCVLFLEPSPDEPKVYLVRGLAAGKISFVERQGQQVAQRSLDGLNLVHPGAPDLVRVLRPETSLGAAQAVLERLRRVVKGGGK
jgi:hypothetical protein